MKEALTNDMVIPEPIRYVWDKAWVRPYESFWSVIRNFRIVNGKCSERDAYRIIGISYNNVKVRPYILYDTASYADRSFTPEDYGLLKNALLPDGYVKEAGVLTRYVSKDPRFLTNRLKYCPECMKNGYHSYLHQVTGMDKCFIHRKTELECDYSGSYAIGIPQKYDFDRSIPSYERVIANFRWRNEELSDLQKSRYDSLPIEWDESAVYGILKSMKISGGPAPMLSIVCPYANDRNTEGSFGKYLFMDKRALSSRVIYKTDNIIKASGSAGQRCSEILKEYRYDEEHFKKKCRDHEIDRSRLAADLVIRDFIGRLLKGIPLNRLILSEYDFLHRGGYDLSDRLMCKLFFIRLITGVVLATDIVDERYYPDESIFPEECDRKICTNLRCMEFFRTGEEYGLEAVMTVAEHFIKGLYKDFKRSCEADSECFVRSDKIFSFSHGLPSYVMEKEENGTVRVFAIKS